MKVSFESEIQIYITLQNNVHTIRFPQEKLTAFLSKLFHEGCQYKDIFGDLQCLPYSELKTWQKEIVDNLITLDMLSMFRLSPDDERYIRTTDHTLKQLYERLHNTIEPCQDVFNKIYNLHEEIGLDAPEFEL